MKWPKELVLIRHAESIYNFSKIQKDTDPEYQKFKELYEEGEKNDFKFSREIIKLAIKLKGHYFLGKSDFETPLTKIGHEQAYKTGRAMSEVIELPRCVFVSPYLRTEETLMELRRGWPELAKIKTITDERIRERQIGLLELYNDYRIFNVFYPEQGRLRKLQKDVYYQFPQGESIIDVQLRNRQAFQTITREYPNKKVWLITHHLTILSIRSLLERWRMEEFIAADKNHKPKNCGITIYKGNPNQGSNGKLVLQEYNKIFY